MSAKSNASESGQEKNLPKTTVQTISHNLTAIQSLPTVQSIQNVQSTVSGVQNIQTAQAVTGQTPGTLVGKQISLELNPKILVKQSGAPGISISDGSKIANFCAPVRIISPNMLPIDRQAQVQGQSSTSQGQIVSNIGNFHVPVGAAAAANINTPRPGVSPVLRAVAVSQSISNTRPSINTTVSNTQWQAKGTPVAHTQSQQQRHPVPVVNRSTGAARPIVYTNPQQQSQQQQQQQQSQTQSSQNQPQLTQTSIQQQSQPRLVTPSQAGRSIQSTVVTGTPPRLLTPLIQTQNNNVTARIPALTRPTTPQVITSIPQGTQIGRAMTQIIQPNQTNRPLATTPVNRASISNPVVGAPNKLAIVTTVHSNVRQLTINTATTSATGTGSRIVLPQSIQQSQSSQGTASRVVQTAASLANFSQASRVITTSTAGAASNVSRVAQTGPSSVPRIAGVTLHSVPSRGTSTPPIKATGQTSTGMQQVTLKSAPTVTIQPQIQQQQQQIQQQQIPALQRTISNVGSGNVVVTSVVNQSQSVQGSSHNPVPTTAQYYSIDASGHYTQYRPTSGQSVRLYVEHEPEVTAKPNASPRPSILRKREHENSPSKQGYKINMNAIRQHKCLNPTVAKNLVPVLASMSSSSIHSPPGSPKADRDGGNHSSGSTTVSATSSPGLDEEPEQSRITINPTIEMSPRKKPRKQQLTGVELIEPRCTEEMQFITEEKIKKEIKEESKEKRNISNLQDFKTPQPAPVKSKPVPSLIGSSWKNQWGGRQHHYRRPSDVRPREERRPSVNEIAQQKHILQKLNGWKVYHLTSQMDDFAETERTVHEKLKATLMMLESQQKNRQDDSLEKANELIKGNMQRSNLISEGMNEARTQLGAIFQHKTHVTDLLQRCGNKRAQKKR